MRTATQIMIGERALMTKKINMMQFCVIGGAKDERVFSEHHIFSD